MSLKSREDVVYCLGLQGRREATGDEEGSS